MIWIKRDKRFNLHKKIIYNRNKRDHYTCEQTKKYINIEQKLKSKTIKKSALLDELPLDLMKLIHE